MRRVYVVHAEGEDEFAEFLARPLREAGYDVTHDGTVLVGDSLVDEAMRAISAGSAIVVCGTKRAIGSEWAHRVVKASYAGEGRTQVFVVQMEEGVYVKQLSLHTKVARYDVDPATALEQLVTALGAHFPREVARKAVPDRPLGRPVRDVTPRELMVSRMLGAEDTHLTPYVRREHDETLSKLVDSAQEGTSGIAILVSDSTSGKTRACYEALRRLDDGWRVWPTSRVPSTMLDDIYRVGPKTVVWLDEAQEYLLRPPEADALTDALSDLVFDRERGPILVLGSVWPENRDELMSRSSGRHLLDGRFVTVPAVFDKAACAAALDTGDPHLADAVRSAEDGAVVQYLAGVPALMARVDSASAPERALMRAAADARRLEQEEYVPEAVLVAAAPGYLDARERRRLTREPHWAAKAVASLTWLGRGDMSPLHPSADNTAHRLEDYLEQHLRRERHRVPPPASFWDACLLHSRVPQLERLAGLAHRRLLYSHVIGFCRRALAAGDVNVLDRWAAVLRMRRDLDGLTRLTEEHRIPDVLLHLARLHARLGDAGAAKSAWRQAESAGHDGPDQTVLADIGRLDPNWVAQRWRGWAASGRITHLKLVHELAQLGLTTEAIAECRAAMEQGRHSAPWTLLTLYDGIGNDEEIRKILEEPGVEEGLHLHPAARRLLGSTTVEWHDPRTVAARLHTAGDLEALRRHTTAHPDKVVRRHLTELLLENGRLDEARAMSEEWNSANRAYCAFLVREGQWLELGRRVAEGNHQASAALLAHLNGHDDLDDTAELIRRHGLTPDGTIAG